MSLRCNWGIEPVQIMRAMGKGFAIHGLEPISALGEPMAHTMASPPPRNLASALTATRTPFGRTLAVRMSARGGERHETNDERAIRMGCWAPIELTEYPVKVTAVGAQELRLALDTTGADELDLELRALRLVGTSLTVDVETNMQNETDNGWISLALSASISSAPFATVRSVKRFLRFVRWRVTAFNATEAFFMIHGVARRWALK